MVRNEFNSLDNFFTRSLTHAGLAVRSPFIIPLFSNWVLKKQQSRSKGKQEVGIWRTSVSARPHATSSMWAWRRRIYPPSFPTRISSFRYYAIIYMITAHPLSISQILLYLFLPKKEERTVLHMCVFFL